MAYSTISKPSLHFNTKLYPGNSSTQSISGVGFQPDWVWIKDRDNSSRWHQLFDAVRGAGKVLYSNDGAQQGDDNTRLSGFASDGFSLGNSANVNNNGNNYVSWNWKAGTGQGSSNTDGSINTTYTSVNTTAGFSISQYTANGTNGATVGHGLGAVPKWIIVKALNTSDNWEVYHASLGAEKYIELQSNAAQSDSDQIWNDTEPTSSVFSIGTNSGVNTNGNPYIAYCFAEKQGYSKFGSYTGNGNVDGTFIYTGFKPAFLMVKRTNSTENWYMKDNKRDPRNEMNQSVLYANGSAAEDTGGAWLKGDALSNGFKIRINDTSSNGSGSTYVYFAFAEEPLVANVGSNGVPATAR